MELISQSLRKVYPDGTEALSKIDLQINDGLFGLLGPNGAGKTTLMEIITLLLEPTSGELIIDGISAIKKPNKIRGMIGYLPQNFGFFPELTAQEFLLYLASLRGIPSHQRHKQVDTLLSMVRLHAVRNKRLKTYSGGMLRRVGIAQALLDNPKLIVVDEPTAGLDPEERVHFRNLLFELREGRIVILSTHIVKDIEETCTNMALIYKGHIQFEGNPSQFIQAAQGQTWEFYGNTSDLDFYTKSPNLVSIREDEHGICFRMIADSPPKQGAVKVIPNLEDAYVHFLDTQKTAA